MKRQNISIFILSLLSLAAAAVAISPAWREQIKETLRTEHREIIGKVVADITGHGDVMTILKVETADGLSLEIYSKENSPESKKQKINLSQKKDGFFDFQGGVTNLALYDIDHDGTLEIVVPSFDDDLIPRLNVYKYNPESHDFDPLSSN